MLNSILAKPTVQEVANLQAKIDWDGEVTVSRSEVPALCDDASTLSQQWQTIWRISVQQRWALIFQSNGSVGLSSLGLVGEGTRQVI